MSGLLDTGRAAHRSSADSLSVDDVGRRCCGAPSCLVATSFTYDFDL